MDAGYEPVSMPRLCDCLEAKAPMPAKTVHVTFDDGFSCVLEHAAPVLRRHGMPATMFALSDRLGARNDWMTARGFPERDILPASGLRELEAAGFTIGSHTRSHARLTEISSEDARDEIANSKSRLEDTLGKPVEFFAYPFGKVSDPVRGLAVQAGYRAACSTRSGFNRPGEDPFLLRRIDVFGTDRMWQFRQKLKFGINQASRSYPLRYLARRVLAKLP